MLLLTSGRYLYLINELDCTIFALEYYPESGGLTELQTVSSLPEGVDVANNSCADIHITPDGTYLYGSNRGHDSLVCYRVEQKSGLLSYAKANSRVARPP